MRTFFDTFIGSFSRLSPTDRCLDGDFILCPPVPDYGYESTPQNALTFSAMGVDGVHDAILKIKGTVRDDSPVIQVSPMDSDDITILAPSFLSYLADGCGASAEEMKRIFANEQTDRTSLVPFLMRHFRSITLLEKSRISNLNAKYMHLIQRKLPRHQRQV